MFYFLMFYCFLCTAWGGLMFLCNKIYDYVEKRQRARMKNEKRRKY